MEILVVVVVVLGIWALLGFHIARENEQVAVIRLGRPMRRVSSGPFHIWFPFEWVRRYPTKVEELQIAQRDGDKKIVRDTKGRPEPAGGFVSKERDGFGSVNVGVSLSVRFCWPANETSLVNCIRLLPDPSDKDGLVDLFQELVMEAVRSVGRDMTYLEVMAQRERFAHLITAQFTSGKAGQLLQDTGLADSMQVIIDHLDIPAEVLAAIDAKEIQKRQAEGAREKAQGEKSAEVTRAEGRAEAIIKLKAADPDGRFTALDTLTKMANGPATTVFMPFDAIQKLVTKLTKGDKV